MKNLGMIKKATYYKAFPFGFLGFILPIYAVELGASAVEIGLLYSAFSIFTILLRPVVGWFVDKYGRKKGIIIGAVGYLMVLIALFMGRGYNSLLISRILQSIAGAFWGISLNALIVDNSHEENIATNFGIMQMCTNRGAFVGSIIGFTILFNNIFDGFRNIFGIYIVFIVIAIYHALKFKEEQVQSSSRNLSEDKKELNISSKSGFKKYLVIIFFMSLCGSLITPVFFVYVRDTITDNYILMSYIFVPAAILGTMLPAKCGRLVDKWGKEKVVFGSFIISACFTFIMPFTKGFIPFMIIYTLDSITGMISSPALGAITTYYCGKNRVGRTFSIKSLVAGLGATLGPIIGGVLYSNFGQYIIFFVDGVALIICAIAFVVLLRKNNKVIKTQSLTN